MQPSMETGTSLTSNFIGTVTLLNFTCNLSTVNGSAFISNPSVRLSGFVDRKLTLTGGGKTLVGWVKSAGTGETTTELITVSDDRTFTSDTGFWSKDTGVSIAGGKCVFTAVAANAGINKTALLTSGLLYKGIMTITDYTSGSAGWVAGASGTAHLTKATFTDYITATSADLHLFGMDAGGSTLNIDNVSFSSVNLPSTDGVRIVSAKQGATYNWTSNNGIVPNGTYTLVVSLT